MKIFRLSLILLSSMIVLSGCTSTDQAKKEKEEISKIKKIKGNLDKILEKEKLEAEKFAASHAENYYKALKDKDYASLCKSKKISKRQFNQWYNAISKAYGKLQSKEYIGSISNPLIIRHMWRWKFSKKVNGKTVNLEALCNVFIAKDKETKKYVLFMAGLQ